jgi:transposase
MKAIQITRTSPSKHDLRRLYQNEGDGRMKERYHATFLMHIYKSAEKVAEIVLRSKPTIISWIKAFNESGIKGLARDSPPGKKYRLSEEQMEELKGDVLKNPRELGYEFSNWEGKSVAHHILKKFGVKLRVRATQKLLHKLGFSLQRPRYKLVKADPEAQKEFKHALKKKWTLSDQTMSLHF